MPQMTKKQKEIAGYMIENSSDLTLLNAPIIARNANVSEATLTRFIYSIGYRSFSEFQMDIRRQIQALSLEHNPFRQESIMDSNLPIYERVFNLEANLLEEMRRKIDPEVFEIAVNKLYSADNVMVVGGPVSDHLARYFSSYLSVIRKNVLLANRLDLVFLGNLQNMGADSVAVVLSYPRYPKVTLNMAQALADKGVTVIGITDSEDSPLVDIASHIFYAPQKYFICVAPCAMTFAFLHALLIGIYQQDKASAKKRFDSYEHDILKLDIFEYKKFNFAEML